MNTSTNRRALADTLRAAADRLADAGRLAAQLDDRGLLDQLREQEAELRGRADNAETAALELARTGR